MAQVEAKLMKTNKSEREMEANSTHCVRKAHQHQLGGERRQEVGRLQGPGLGQGSVHGCIVHHMTQELSEVKQDRGKIFRERFQVVGQLARSRKGEES